MFLKNIYPFKIIHQKYKLILDRLIHAETGINNISDKFNQMENKLQKITDKSSKLDAILSKLNSKLNELDHTLNNKFNELDYKLDKTVSNNDELKNTFNKIENEVNLISNGMLFFMDHTVNKFIENQHSGINVETLFKYMHLKINQATRILPSVAVNTIEHNHGFLKICFTPDTVFFNVEPNKYIDDRSFDLFLIWGNMPTLYKSNVYLRFLQTSSNLLLYIEDGFIRSLFPVTKQIDERQKCWGISFTFDPFAPYYDATKSSLLEMILNSDLKLTKEQIARSKLLIKKIIENKITKYNHQPINSINIGTKDKKKILLVDQSYGDYSIVKGCANDNTFYQMLQCAINENPDSDIIIKTHPDEIASDYVKGYYSNLTSNNNVYIIRDEINPISIIQHVDKVYVVTTQLGFEAIMCGKEVAVFGMPFYAGWGLTEDRQTCSRRTNKRTLEELFFITYIMYTIYISPITGKKCEIEEAIEYIIETRKDSFGV